MCVSSQAHTVRLHKRTNMENEKRIDEIMGSLDGAARAEASPYFYSKLRARIERQPLIAPRMAWRLVLALALIAVINLLTLRAVNDTPAGDDASAQSIATEYGMTLPEAY